jgi:hypothetical protein
MSGHSSDWSSRVFGCGSPFRHGIKAMQMSGKSEAAGTGRNDEVAYRREDTREPLQASRRSKGSVANFLFQSFSY